VTPLSGGVVLDALEAGFVLGLAVTLSVWWAVVGLAILRRMLSE
jgi:hypothetical protein